MYKFRSRILALGASTEGIRKEIAGYNRLKVKYAELRLISKDELKRRKDLSARFRRLIKSQEKCVREGESVAKKIRSIAKNRSASVIESKTTFGKKTTIVGRGEAALQGTKARERAGKEVGRKKRTPAADKRPTVPEIRRMPNESATIETTIPKMKAEKHAEIKVKTRERTPISDQPPTNHKIKTEPDLSAPSELERRLERILGTSYQTLKTPLATLDNKLNQANVLEHIHAPLIKYHASNNIDLNQARVLDQVHAPLSTSHDVKETDGRPETSTQRGMEMKSEEKVGLGPETSTQQATVEGVKPIRKTIPEGSAKEVSEPIAGLAINDPDQEKALEQVIVPRFTYHRAKEMEGLLIGPRIKYYELSMRQATEEEVKPKEKIIPEELAESRAERAANSLDQTRRFQYHNTEGWQDISAQQRIEERLETSTHRGPMGKAKGKGKEEVEPNWKVKVEAKAVAKAIAKAEEKAKEEAKSKAETRTPWTLGREAKRKVEVIPEEKAETKTKMKTCTQQEMNKEAKGKAEVTPEEKAETKPNTSTQQETKKRAKQSNIAKLKEYMEQIAKQKAAEKSFELALQQQIQKRIKYIGNDIPPEITTELKSWTSQQKRLSEQQKKKHPEAKGDLTPRQRRALQKMAKKLRLKKKKADERDRALRKGEKAIGLVA